MYTGGWLGGVTVVSQPQKQLHKLYKSHMECTDVRLYPEVNDHF